MTTSNVYSYAADMAAVIIFHGEPTHKSNEDRMNPIKLNLILQKFKKKCRIMLDFMYIGILTTSLNENNNSLSLPEITAKKVA